MTKIKLLLSLGFTIIHIIIFAQSDTKLLKYYVKDAENLQPLSDASIHWINHHKTNFTEKDGLFFTPQWNKDSIIISHTGYITKKIAVADLHNDEDILLTPLISDLENVSVNTGYQKLKANEVNGAVYVVDNKTLNLQTGTNILQRLNGVTSSLLFNIGKQNNNPQNSTSISIRGLSTINGPLDPLIVLDNFIYSGDINSINPNDVENVTLLKDAAAASIWGARAGNGVIVITTKKGKFNQPVKMGFNSNVILDAKPDLFYNAQITSSDYIDFQQYLFKNGYYSSLFSDNTHPAISPAVQIFNDESIGNITTQEAKEKIDELKKIDARKLYKDYYYRNSITQQYSLNLRGGGNNISWLLSGNYDKVRDNQDGSSRRLNFRFENTYHPIKNINVTVSAYYNNSSIGTGLPDYKSIATINYTQYIPYLPIAGKKGESIALIKNYDSRYIDTAGNGKLMDWRYYPLEDYKHNQTKTTTEAIVAEGGINYNIVKGINLSVNYQYQKQNVANKNLADTSSFYTRDLINTFSSINTITGVVNRNIPQGGILTLGSQSQNAYNFRTQLNIDQAYLSYQFSSIIGMEVRRQWSSGNAATYYGYNEEPLTDNSGIDFSNYLPTYLGGSKMIPTATTLTGKNDYRFLSYFNNNTISKDNKYSLSLSIRKDGSNIFGANTNDKWKPLWSTAGGWVLSREKFYKLNFVPFLKLTVSYGVSGNVDLSKTALPVGRSATSTFNGLKYIEINQLNNPELSWERAYQGNIKLDFKVMHFLEGSIEYYQKKSTNLYAQTPYDYTTWGYSATITSNVADMKGNGWDIVLRSRNINSTIQWNTSLLLNSNTSKTTAYYSTTSSLVSNFIGQGNTITPVIGKPLYAVAAYKWAGLDNMGNPQGFLNGNKSIDYAAIQTSAFETTDKDPSFVYIGSATPTIFGSLLNSINYKRFGLNINIIYKFNYYLFKPALSYTALANSGTNGLDFDNRWQNSGDENKTNIPSLRYPLDGARDLFFSQSEINVIKGDNIKLQFVNFTYSFPWLLRKSGTSNTLQLYINASNLGILWRANKNHIDPDYPNTIAPPKQYTIGIRAEF